MASESNKILTETEVRDMLDRLNKKEREIEEKAKQLRELQRLTEPSEIANSLVAIQNKMSEIANVSVRLDRLEETLDRTLDTDRRDSDASSEQIRPSLSSQDAINYIPSFNGYNISVYAFIDKIEYIQEAFPRRSEQSLLITIIGKLKGDAAKAVEGDRFASINELTSKLKAIFSPRQTLNDFYGELGKLCKRSSENMIDYIARTKNIIYAIIDGERMERGTLTNIERKRIERRALGNFMSGLPSELHTRLRSELPRDLDDAFLKSISCEKTLEIEAENRRNMLSRERPRKDPPKFENKSSPQSANEPRIQYNNRSQEQFRPSTNKVCNYCKKPGHSKEECRKLAFKESQKIQGGSGNYPGTPRTGDAYRSAPTTSRPTLPIQINQETEN